MSPTLCRAHPPAENSCMWGGRWGCHRSFGVCILTTASDESGARGGSFPGLAAGRWQTWAHSRGTRPRGPGVPLTLSPPPRVSHPGPGRRSQELSPCLHQRLNEPALQSAGVSAGPGDRRVPALGLLRPLMPLWTTLRCLLRRGVPCGCSRPQGHRPRRVDSPHPCVQAQTRVCLPSGQRSGDFPVSPWAGSSGFTLTGTGGPHLASCTGS